MDAAQLLKQVIINRDLIVRRNDNAREHLEMLTKNYAHLISGEVAITIEMNRALACLYLDCDYKAAMQVSLKAIAGFEHSPYKSDLAFHKKMVAHCYIYLGQYDSGIQYLTDAINTLDTTDPKYGQHKSDILFTMAQAEEFKNPQSEQMAGHLQEALALLSGDIETVRKANCLMGLGNYYINANKPAEALGYFQEAVVTFEKKYLLQHISNTYSNIGICYLQLSDYEQAENYMQKALDLRLKTAAPDMLAVSYTNFSKLYWAQKDGTKALEFLRRSQKIVEETGYKHLMDINSKLLSEINAAADSSNEIIKSSF